MTEKEARKHFGASGYVAPVAPGDKVDGYLAVGVNDDGEVVINLDHDRTGHIVFSPTQARNLAHLLLKQADIAIAKKPHAFGSDVCKEVCGPQNRSRK